MAMMGRMAIGADPCYAPVVTPFSLCVAFRDSPYGINRQPDVNALVPYLINPDLTIDFRVDLAILGFDLDPVVVLDDSTMVAASNLSDTSTGLVVISRSGTAIVASGVQAVMSKVNTSVPTLARINSTTIARGFIQAGGSPGVIDILTVGGGSVSQIGVNQFANIVEADNAPGRSLRGEGYAFLHHSNGSFLFGLGVQQGLPPPGGSSSPEMAHALSGGTITASYLTDLPGGANNASFSSGNTGTGELCFNSGSPQTTFYWDGSAGHFDPNAPDHGSFASTATGGTGDGDATHPYLDLDGRVEVTQSGLALVSSPIEPVLLCDALDGSYEYHYGGGSVASDGVAAAARHGPGNLAAFTSLLDPFYALRAARW